MKLFRTTALALSAVVLTVLCAALFSVKTNTAQIGSENLTGCRFTLENTLSPQSLRIFSTAEENYLFIPSCADTLTFTFEAHHAEIDGEVCYSGCLLSTDTLCGVHSFRFFDADGGETEAIELSGLLSGEIPAVFIATATGSYSANTDKLRREYCTVEIVNPDGSDEYGNVHPYSDVIRGHGNSTWRDHEKRSYNLYLQFAEDLFGMGQSDEWVILANAADRTGIRNKLVYDYASQIGLEYSPESRFVDVYFDGLYHGTYLLCERPQSGRERVDIGDDGILFTMEAGIRLTGKESEHITEKGQQLVRLEPEANNGGWTQRFVRIVDGFEERISSDFTFSELEKYIDVESWAKMGIIEELFSDLDAWTTSQYFYIKSDSDIIYAGPVWDFDSSSGNSSGTLSTEKTDLINLLDYNCDTNYLGEPTPWFYLLMQNKEFYDHVRSVFAEEIYPDFEEKMLLAVNTCLDTLSPSRRMNAIRWILPDGSADTEHLEEFLMQRLDFFRRIWIDCEPFHSVTYRDTGVSLAYFDGEECPADLYYYNWFFDKERTRPAKAFIPEGDTVLYAEVDEPYPR